MHFSNGRECQDVLNVVRLFTFYVVYMLIEDSNELLVLSIGYVT